jgi:hypothetical protein
MRIRNASQDSATTHHSLNRLGCVPHMLLSNRIIIMGILKYYLEDDILNPDYVYYHVNDNFNPMVNFKANLSNLNRVIKCRKEEDKKLQ